jgi:hypothetical protein
MPLKSIENITVGTITGHSASFPVAADSTLGGLKLLIAEQLNIPVQAQRLVVASDNRDVEGWLRILAHRRLRDLVHERLLVVAVPIDEAEDQEDNSPRTTEAPKYKIVNRATLRASFDLDSDEVGILEPGDIIDVLQQKKNAHGQMHVKCEVYDLAQFTRGTQGWTSVRSRDGQTLMRPFPTGSFSSWKPFHLEAPAPAPPGDRGLEETLGITMVPEIYAQVLWRGDGAWKGRHRWTPVGHQYRLQGTGYDQYMLLTQACRRGALGPPSKPPLRLRTSLSYHLHRPLVPSQ